MDQKLILYTKKVSVLTFKTETFLFCCVGKPKLDETCKCVNQGFMLI